MFTNENNKSNPIRYAGYQCEAGNCGNLQLNMFSGRSYEWWEAGNPASYRNVSAYYNSDGEYQSPYEDEFSQEVYYDE